MKGPISLSPQAFTYEVSPKRMNNYLSYPNSKIMILGHSYNQASSTKNHPRLSYIRGYFQTLKATNFKFHLPLILHYSLELSHEGDIYKRRSHHKRWEKELTLFGRLHKGQNNHPKGGSRAHLFQQPTPGPLIDNLLKQTRQK